MVTLGQLHAVVVPTLQQPAGFSLGMIASPHMRLRPLTAEIAHHNEVAKLRKLHRVVKSTRQQLAGCIDPSASNYNPDAVVDDGTCEYVFQVCAPRKRPQRLQTERKGAVHSWEPSCTARC